MPSSPASRAFCALQSADWDLDFVGAIQDFGSFWQDRSMVILVIAIVVLNFVKFLVNTTKGDLR